VINISSEYVVQKMRALTQSHNIYFSLNVSKSADNECIISHERKSQRSELLILSFIRSAAHAPHFYTISKKHTFGKFPIADA
jgi:protease II